MKQRLWIERVFKLGLPPEHLPEILERLRGTPARIEDRLRGVPRAILLKTPPGAGSWSIQTHVGHLIDLEALWQRRFEELTTGAAELSAADMSNAQTNNAGHDTHQLQDLLTEFRFVRMRFVHSLSTVDLSGLKRRAQHPRLNVPMGLVDLAFFAAEHDDHHLAKITSILQSV